MTLDNEAADDSAFFSPDDPTSEAADAVAQNDAADEADLVEGDDTDLAPEMDENGDPIAKPDEPDTSADDEFEEIEHAGKKHKIPKGLKPLLMMQQDYTRKTQEVAESRKAVEQFKAQVEADLAHQAETVQHFTREIAQLHALDERIQQYSSYSPEQWRAWQSQDYLAADAAWKEWQMLERQRSSIANDLQQRHSKARQEAEHRSREAQRVQEAELAKRREETVRTIQREIPGWNEEVAGKVAEFAMRTGYTREELINAAVDPRAFILLHKAWRGEQLEAQQKAAASKAKANIQPEARPLTPVAKGRSAPATAGLDDRLSPDEWVRRRNEQLRKRA